MRLKYCLSMFSVAITEYLRFIKEIKLFSTLFWKLEIQDGAAVSSEISMLQEREGQVATMAEVKPKRQPRFS